METATIAPKVKLTDAELLCLATKYISLRNELMDRGAVLSKEIEKRAGKTLVVFDGESHYELARNFSPGRYELPVGVSPADVLRSDLCHSPPESARNAWESGDMQS